MNSTRNPMLLKNLLTAGVLSLVLAGTVASAQTNVVPQETQTTTTDVGATDPSLDDADRNGRVLDTETRESLSSDGSEFQPTSPTSVDLAPEIKTQVDAFSIDRDRYLAEYRRLLEKLKRGATEAERIELRRQIRYELRRRWQRISDERKKEGKDRVLELRRKIPSHREIMEDAREKVRDQLQDLRKRRGDE